MTTCRQSGCIRRRLPHYSVCEAHLYRGEVGSDGQSLARISGEPRMREDVVRVGRGGTDLRGPRPAAGVRLAMERRLPGRDMTRWAA